MKPKKKTEYMKFVEKEMDLLLESYDLPDTGLSDISIGFYNGIKKDVVALCAELEKHSGNVNNMRSKAIVRLFAKLASHIPLTPLTGADDEWVLLMDPEDGDPDPLDILYQNKRCTRVYKRRNGTAFDVEGRVFSYDGSTWFRNKDSIKDITFPYMVPVRSERIMLEKPKEPEEMN